MRSLPCFCCSLESEFIKFRTKLGNFLKVDEKVVMLKFGAWMLFSSSAEDSKNQTRCRFNWRQAAVGEIKFSFRIDAINRRREPFKLSICSFLIFFACQATKNERYCLSVRVILFWSNISPKFSSSILSSKKRFALKIYFKKKLCSPTFLHPVLHLQR